MTDILASTRRYERWLATHVRLVPTDLRSKHAEMTRDPFRFMRATFYRWCERWREVDAAVREVSPVLAVGDLHVENFGTWRDADGRLVWGINDFDECAPMPWTIDLVRLAVSVALAIEQSGLRLDLKEACATLLDGYTRGLAHKGQPFVLEEEHHVLRRAATGRLRDPVEFWRKMSALPRASAPDREAVRRIVASLPEPGLAVGLFRRTAGLGSRGRARYVGIASWRGGRVAREAKALAPSAWFWAHGRHTGRSWYRTLLRTAVRVPDPTVSADGRWVVRRLAPHCTRIELEDLPANRDEHQLLHAMGFEIANVHLATPGARARLARERRTLTPRKLERVVRDLALAIEADWSTFRKRRGPI